VGAGHWREVGFSVYVIRAREKHAKDHRSGAISMQILQTLLVVLFFVSCAALIFFILIQSGKGGSLGIMGGGGSGSPFGSSTVDVVEKATWYGIAAFLILAILSAIAFADHGIKIEPIESAAPAAEESAPAQSLPANPAPAQNTPVQPAPAQNLPANPTPAQ
jgi:protein translocase SecG subunit